MLPSDKCQADAFVAGLGPLEAGIETGIGRVHDRPQIRADRCHADETGIGIHDRLGRAVTLLPHRRDGRGQLVHLGGDVAFQPQQPRLLVRACHARLLQFDHQLRQPFLRPGIGFEIGLAAGNQKAALAALGILDRLVDGIHGADYLEAGQRIGAGDPRFRHVFQQLEGDHADDEQ